MTLFALLAGGQTLSGRELAAHLGVSRAAVWKQIETLRKLGLDVRARPAHGYRLDTPLDVLDASQIRSALSPAARLALGGLSVHWEIDSTSSELSRCMDAATRFPLICVAEIQTRGRGRRGRAWQMPLGGGIALSMLQRFDRSMASLAGLSLVAGLAAIDALEDCGMHGVGLKWPNDLVVGQRKLGGVLVELRGDAMGPCLAVIGTGINSRIGRAGAVIDQPWIDLAELAGGTPPPRNLVAARLIERLIDATDRFAESGFGPFAAAYARHDMLRDRAIRVVSGESARDGIALGVDVRGALRVAFADGEQKVDAAEVSIRTPA